MPVSEEHSRRIEELEVRVAFQEDLVSTLNRDVAEASREIGELRRLIARLRGELELIRNGLSPDPRSEPPPPHY
jgi:SlyX protein